MQLIRILGILFVTIFLHAGGFAQETQPEIWLGELDVKAAKLRLEVRLSIDADNVPSATLISLDQNNSEINVDEVKIDGQQIELSLNDVRAKFVGVIDKETNTWSGTFTQGGQEFPLTFKKVDEVPNRIHVATWQGVLRAAGQEFEFQLRVFEEGDKTLALLDSFSESRMGLATEFLQDDDEFRFEVPISGGKFVGTLNEDNTQVDGKWFQRGGEYELKFDSVPVGETRIAKLSRPQTPNPPFPYDSTELKVENSDANLVLVGTLTTPPQDGPFPTVILVSGSGPQDRDETIVGHKPFLVLADHLTRAGFAVFRYDERGVGESTGTFEGATTEDFAADVEKIFEFLCDNPLVDTNNIGIIGHSEGGLVAPMIAARNRKVSFIVMMAGPGVTGERILLTQSREISEVEGVPRAALDLNEQILGMVLEQVSIDPDDVLSMEKVIEEFKKTLSDEDREDFEIPESALEQFAQFQTPWFRFFIHYDPVPALKKVECDVLSIIGEKDLQVNCEMNQLAIESAFKESGNASYKIERLPGLNHLFQKSKTGSPSEYSRIEETLNPKFLEVLTSWLLERVK